MGVEPRMAHAGCQRLGLVGRRRVLADLGLVVPLVGAFFIDLLNAATIKFFIYTLIGSVAMLLAILLTYFATGTFDIIDTALANPPKPGTKSPEPPKEHS